MKKEYLKTCVTCELPFLSHGKSTKYCSKECRATALAKLRGKCTQPGCDKTAKCKGLCESHYKRLCLRPKKLKPCGCGCGQLTEYGYVWGHNTRLLTSEEQTRRGRMNNGDSMRDRGSSDWYRKVRGRHEHRIVAEQMLGRPLMKGEIVHHKNHDKKDNRPENLEVMRQSEHARIHSREYWEKKRNG